MLSDSETYKQVLIIDGLENRLENTESSDNDIKEKSTKISTSTPPLQSLLIPQLTQQCLRNFFILCVSTDFIRISFILLHFSFYSYCQCYSIKLLITMLFVIPYLLGVALWIITLSFEDVKPIHIKYIFPKTDNKYLKLFQNIVQSIFCAAFNVILNHFFLFYHPMKNIINEKSNEIEATKEILFYLSSSKNKNEVRHKIIAINYCLIYDKDHKLIQHIKQLYNVKHHCKDITFSSIRDLYGNLNAKQSSFYHALVSIYFYLYGKNNSTLPTYYYPMLFGFVLCGSVIITFFPFVQFLCAFNNIFILYITVYIICEIFLLLFAFTLFYPVCYYLYHILPNCDLVPMDSINLECVNVLYDKMFINYERYLISEQLFGKEIANITLMYYKCPLDPPLSNEEQNYKEMREVHCWDYASNVESWCNKTDFENIDQIGYLCECSNVTTNNIREQRVYPVNIAYIMENRIFVTVEHINDHFCPYDTKCYGWIDIPSYRIYAPPVKHAIVLNNP